MSDSPSLTKLRALVAHTQPRAAILAQPGLAIGIQCDVTNGKSCTSPLELGTIPLEPLVLFDPLVSLLFSESAGFRQAIDTNSDYP
jgi:hypothetical protein